MAMLKSPRLLPSLLFLPTGEFRTPVCVGDIPSSHYQVSVDTITETVTRHLEQNPEIPGVVLMDGDQLHSAIPRARIYERLGHMYGVELFLRKPILQLQQNLGTKAYSISSNLSIQQTVEFALARPIQDIYNPLVIVFDNGQVRLLGMHTLLIAQSQTLQSVNNVMTSLSRLKQMVELNAPLDETLNLSFEALHRVVPYHGIALHIRDLYAERLQGKHIALHFFDEQHNYNTVFRVILNNQQSLNVDDVRAMPTWRELDRMDGVRAWLGMPLLDSSRTIGVFSIMRFTPSPFGKDEMEIAKAFAELISTMLSKTLHPTPAVEEPKLKQTTDTRSSVLL